MWEEVLHPQGLGSTGVPGHTKHKSIINPQNKYPDQDTKRMRSGRGTYGLPGQTILSFTSFL